jgi:hypothetical protein
MPRELPSWTVEQTIVPCGLFAIGAPRRRQTTQNDRPPHNSVVAGASMLSCDSTQTIVR